MAHGQLQHIYLSSGVRRSAARGELCGGGTIFCHFRGDGTLASRRGHAFQCHMIFTLSMPSTPQVVGYRFLTFSAAAQAARVPAAQQWWLQFHSSDFEEPLPIMPNHRACAATVPCTPQSPLTLVCLVLPLRQETWREFAL